MQNLAQEILPHLLIPSLSFLLIHEAIPCPSKSAALGVEFGNLTSQLKRPLPELDGAHHSLGEKAFSRAMSLATLPKHRFTDAPAAFQEAIAEFIRRMQRD